MPKNASRDFVKDSPVYWFALMELAKNDRDFESALNAQRQLERLGVFITFRRPSAKGAIMPPDPSV